VEEDDKHKKENHSSNAKAATDRSWASTAPMNEGMRANILISVYQYIGLDFFLSSCCPALSAFVLFFLTYYFWL
jgi:hypothetical protein